MDSPAGSRNVRFYARDGAKIAGVLTLPPDAAGGRGRPPGVLLCQGLSGRKELIAPFIARQFAEVGLASLRFDYRGFGESEGPRGWIDPFARVDDALHAFAYLSEVEEVDPHRLAVYGLSLGGPVAIALAAQEPRVRAVVAVSAPSDGERLLRGLRTEAEWVEFLERVRRDRGRRAMGQESTKVDVAELFPFSQSFLTKYSRLSGGEGTSSISEPPPGQLTTRVALGCADLILAFHAEDAAGRLGVRPLLLVAGEQDDVATPDQVRVLFDRASGPRELVMMPQRDHVDLDTGDGLVAQVKIARDWLARQLRPGPH